MRVIPLPDTVIVAVLGLVDVLAPYVTVNVLLPVILPAGTVHHAEALDDADHDILDVTPTFTEPELTDAVPVLALSVSEGGGAVLPLWVRSYVRDIPLPVTVILAVLEVVDALSV